MKLRLQQFYDSVVNSFWFLPTIMALIAAGGAIGSVALDQHLGDDWMQEMAWIWAGSADGARSVMSVIAGSIMTVVSIVFSITVTTLAQTSSHFGPRVLRNFTSDRGNQIVLGTFIATFVYCLLILRTVRSVEESRFVPYLSVNIGIVLALASLAVLIYFIHHISTIIQADHLIAEVGEDFQRSLPVLFPERIGEGKPQEESQELDWSDAYPVVSCCNGYVQRVDDRQLMRLACAHDIVIKLKRRPGDFVTRDSPLLQVLPPSRITDDVAHSLSSCFGIGRQRTPHQDAQYSLQQLVEIAAHALSPGINEPYTALTCIDWLGASLSGVAQRDIPLAQRCDEHGNMRVVAPSLSFEEMTATAFDQIRIYGAENPDVMVRLLDIIAELSPHLWRAGDREILIEHARRIGADAARKLHGADHQRVERHLQQTLRALAEAKIQ